jgi:hypothetical protein
MRHNVRSNHVSDRMPGVHDSPRRPFGLVPASTPRLCARRDPWTGGQAHVEMRSVASTHDRIRGRSLPLRDRLARVRSSRRTRPARVTPRAASRTGRVSRATRVRHAPAREWGRQQVLARESQVSIPAERFCLGVRDAPSRAAHRSRRGTRALASVAGVLSLRARRRRHRGSGAARSPGGVLRTRGSSSQRAHLRYPQVDNAREARCSLSPTRSVRFVSSGISTGRF